MPELIPPAAPAHSPAEPPNGFRTWLIFGTGLGIAVNGDNLAVAIARSRSAGPRLAASTTILNFRHRPATEWGNELIQFLISAGEPNLAATFVLPREEVIVRTINLPGVPDKEIPAAVELQLETLHPYGDEDVAWSWLRARQDSILIGIVRRASLDFWETLFSEAGIPVAAATFSSAAIHAALRVWASAAPAGFLLHSTSPQGRTEIYGESEARAVFSADFAMPAERALALARAELRLPPEASVLPLAAALPSALPGPQSPSAEVCAPLAWAAALAASAPFTTNLANFIPKDRRASNARRQYLATIVLAGLLVTGLIIAFVAFPAIERSNYLSALNSEIHRLDPAARHAQELEQKTGAIKARIAMLDDVHRRPQADLEILAELTRILPPQVWTNSLEIFPDSVVVAGEADQAAPLLKLLDSSPLFQNSEFALSVTRNTTVEQFRIKTMRRNRAGRTTP